MMRISIFKIFAIVTLLAGSSVALAQGLVENELTSNAILVSKYNATEAKMRVPTVIDTIDLGVLGFLDDFSKPGPYPDTNLWIDDKVFINRTFAKAPITLGVATFEGLNNNGYPYDFTFGATSSAVADYLTSKPINLNYPASDSLYFSFYCQPQGNGNAPEYLDSLVLQFKHSVSGWRNVWAAKGTTLSAADSSWQFVMVPITDTAYLKGNFQFRFYNRATLSGNCDHWNIDYVYLNRIRSQNDTAFEDVGFVYDTPSLLNNYTAMPWRQYDTTEMKTVYNTVIRNNHTATKNGSFAYTIKDDLGNVLNSPYSGGSFNLDPFSVIGYVNYAPFSTPPLNYKIPAPLLSSRYHIESVLNTAPDKDRWNDTVDHVQDITNYFSYDDGSAENSFGLSTLHAQLAEKFTMKVGDSLRYVDIYFNPFTTNASAYTFVLQVWAEGGSTPGAILYTSSAALTPAYSMVMQNQFIRYPLDAPLYLAPGNYYVGFTQNTNQFLNVGVDKNTNSQTKIFYNVTGVWNTSPFVGSLMLHPVFGHYYEFTGIGEASLKPASEMVVYPNPANDFLYIKSTESKLTYSIIDVLGKIINEQTLYTDAIDISALKNGIYFIRISDGTSISTHKFIKAN